MKCTILHESNGRMRVHLKQFRMTMAQADKVEYFLRGISGVSRVKVSERTADAVIWFARGRRETVIRALSEFDYEETEVAVPENTGRELQHRFEDKMFWQIAVRFVNKLFLPAPLRVALTTWKAIPYILKALDSLRRGKLEVSVLDAASITVSMARGDFDTAGSVMFLLKFGDLMEEWTHRKTVNDLARAMSLNIDRVWVRSENGQEVLMDIAHIRKDDHIIVRTGSVIPLDGVVTAGDSAVNQASITGESLPVRKSEGSMVYAGTVVEEGELEICVQQVAGSSRYDKIVGMIEESEKLKSVTEAQASHLADRLVPYTFGATLLTYAVTRNITKAISILMVDFCCALKLSMPLAVLSAMREAGDHRISVKGGKFLEAVAQADTIVFDKTGTLTDAEPTVAGVVTFGENDGRECLRLAACLEEHYPHSIANAVVQKAFEEGLLHEEHHSSVEYVVAHGIVSSVDGKRVLIGSRHFVFEDENCSFPEEEQEKYDALPEAYSHLYLAIDNRLAAVILIEDPIKQEAAAAIRHLHELGIRRIVMMTGDNKKTAEAVAAMVGVDEVYAEVLPEDKARFVKEERLHGRRVIMVGDGINDSPALSEADAGIAISSGAAIAREIADITIAADDLEELVTLRRLSCLLMDRIRINYRAILGFNSFLILMGMFGILTPTATAILHNGSTVLIGMNSMTDLLEKK